MKSMREHRTPNHMIMKFLTTYDNSSFTKNDKQKIEKFLGQCNCLTNQIFLWIHFSRVIILSIKPIKSRLTRNYDQQAKCRTGKK